MIVGKVTAIDPDNGPNRQIRYELINNTDEFFIHEQLGIIRLAKTLDRELRAFYNLTIIASDTNLHYLHSNTSFCINVTDINDNAPEFELQSYQTALDENVSIGTEVIKIFATSKDTGVNAVIHYRIVSGNTNNTFSIDTKTGLVIVEQELDYESINEYYLIIEAKDQGVPPLSSEVNLLININDINDMRPQFSQRSMMIVLREDAKIGDKIYQTVASDGDSPANANLTYSFENGSLSYKEFQIEPLTGMLIVGKELDREMISSYVLEIFCTDNGKPAPLMSSIIIKVEISDFNDNPPLFEKSNQIIYLKETRPIGFTIFEFNVHDADSSLNSAPFKLELVDGNDENKFAIAGTLLITNQLFNQTEKSEYNLTIKATDSGIPPLHSFCSLTIIIIQESKYAPNVSTLSIVINSLDHFPGGIIGQINATDEDPFDKLTYSITNPEDENIFSIDVNEGFLRAFSGLDIGKYSINVSASDGKFVSYGLIEVEVKLITEAMIENSMVIKIFSAEINDFVNNYLEKFIQSIRSLFKVRIEDVFVISLQQINGQTNSERRRRRNGEEISGNDLSLMFAIANGKELLDRELVKMKILDNRYFIENQFGLNFEAINYQSKCNQIQCINGKCLDELILNEEQITYIAGIKATFVSPLHEFKFGCICHTGFGGPFCNITVNDCSRNPCPNYKECVPVSSTLGYICQCPIGKSGTYCNQNADSCQANEPDVLFCYQELNPISFNGNSYVRYSNVKKIDKLSFRFRSQQLHGRILTQKNGQLFVILEIVNGYIQYRFHCGAGEALIRIHNVFVSDGKWHEIVLERKSNAASLILDRKHRSGGFASGTNILCNKLKSDIYFGSEIKSNSDNVGDEEILYGFVGCLDNILFNGQQIPFHTTTKSAVAVLKTVANVEFSCAFKPNTGACIVNPCKNGGLCENSNNSFVCNCPGNRFKGKHCEVDTLPCSSSPCLNNGICEPNIKQCEEDSTSNCYHCKCKKGFFGINCQTPDHCVDKYCQNGGICKDTSIGPRCHCYNGWHGLFCEYDIDECQLRTPVCHVNAICINLPGTFRCVCPINSTTNCHTHSLLTTNIIETYFFINYKEILLLLFLLLLLICIAFTTVSCFNCCNNQAKKRKSKKRNQETDESLLNKRNTENGAIYDNFDGSTDKRNNFEMISLMSNNNNINGNYNNNNDNGNLPINPDLISTESNSFVMNDEFDSNQISSAIFCNTDYGQNFRKNAPVASVSPQIIDSKNSLMPKNKNYSNNQTRRLRKLFSSKL